MPIFEDEEITKKEMKRQQKELNEKIFRLQFNKFFDEYVARPEEFDGGDEWEDE